MSTQSLFRKAERSLVYLKLALTGPTGSGKTFSALRMAVGLIAGTDKRIAVLDTENDSASLYSEQFDFDVMNIAPPFPPEAFSQGLLAAVDAGYGVVIIDSASHFWKGILAFKDKLDSHGGNSFTNWKDADRKFDPVVETVLQSKVHVIFCMRSKMDYVLESNAQGKQVPKKVGLAPIMRDGMEYEFSAVLDIGLDHSAQSSKDRTNLFPSDKVFQITEKTGIEIAEWLKTATPRPEQEAPPASAAAPGNGSAASGAHGQPELIRDVSREVTWSGVKVSNVESIPWSKNGKNGQWFKVTFADGKTASTFSETLRDDALAAQKTGQAMDAVVAPSKKKQGEWQLIVLATEDAIP